MTKKDFCQASVERLKRAKGSSRRVQPPAVPAVDRNQHGDPPLLFHWKFPGNSRFAGDLLLGQDPLDVRHLQRHVPDPLA